MERGDGLPETGRSESGHDLVADAVAAARRGEVEDLDLALTRLGIVAPGRSEALSEELHRIARCVRAHPAFGRAAGSPSAAGEDRAAG